MTSKDEKKLSDEVNDEVKIAPAVKASKNKVNEVKDLEKKLTQLQKDCDVLRKSNDELKNKLKELNSTSAQFCKIDGVDCKIVSRSNAKDLFENIKKRLVHEGQTCLVLDREGD